MIYLQNLVSFSFDYPIRSKKKIDTKNKIALRPFLEREKFILWLMKIEFCIDFFLQK